MAYTAKAAVCSEMQSEHRLEFLNVKPDGT